MQLSHMAPATNHKPPGPSRRDFPLANGSANNQIPNPGNPRSAAIREGKKAPAPPGSDLSAQVGARRPNIASPKPVRVPFMRSVPPGLPRQIFRPNGSGDYRDGTSSSVSVTTDDSESPSDEGDESALSSEDGVSRSLHPTSSGPRLPPVPFPMAAVFHHSQWRASPSFGSFHSMHRSWRQMQDSPDRKPDAVDTGDAASVSTDAELHKLRDRVHDQRRKVRRLRADLKEKRREVRALRHKKDEVDNTLMQTLRPYLTPSNKTTSGHTVAVVPIDFLKRRLDAMQRIRDDYYSVESDYERIEIDLDQEEYYLELFETDLYNFEGSETSRSSSAPSGEPEGSNSISNDSGSENESASSRYTLRGISGDLENDVHPLYKELLEAAGDRELVREHHEEIVTHRDRTLYDLERGLHRERVKEKPGNVLSEAELKSLKLSLIHMPTDPEQFKAKFGVSIDPDELEFLQGYEREEEEVRRALEGATQNVDRLRAICVAKGLMPRNPRYEEEVAIATGSSWPDTLQQGGDIVLEDPAPSSTSLASPRFPILLSNPSHVLQLLTPRAAAERAMKLPKDYPHVAQLRAECVKELGIDNLMKSVESKPDYINRWLIHRLRTSPMEAELMYSISEKTFSIVNPRRWQEDVLYFWRKDAAANRSPEDFGGPLTSRNGLGVSDVSVRPGVSSVFESYTRAKSEEGNARPRMPDHRRAGSRSVTSV